jgi:hypothetical protein
MLLALLACTAAPIVPDPVDDTVDDTDTGLVDTDPVPEDTDTIEVIPDDPCDPGAPAVYGEEGEALSVRIACTGVGTADSFEILDLPDGAAWDAATATVTWTPGLADAGHYPLTVLSSGEASDVGVVDVWVADAWAAPANVAVEPLTYTDEYGLPVLHLNRPNETNDYDDVATTMVYGGRPWPVDLKYRGAASSYYPKRSYTLSFPADDEFDDADEGFENRRKIVLTTLFDDNSYLRQLLCYELWSAMDASRHDIQTMLTIVYINGAYEGIYLLSDHIDGEYWEDHGYDEEGSLYKSVTHEANFYATYGDTPKSSWHAGYEKQEGVDGDWSDLDALVQFVATSSDADFSAHVEEYVDIDEITDWWALVRFTEADDSGGKNAYLYADPATGIFHHAPWDFNHALGQTWQTEREASSTDYDFYWSNNLFKRLLADATHGPRMEARMRAHLAGALANEAVQLRIDTWMERIAPSTARDWEKWETQYRGYGGWYWRTDWTSHEEEVAYLKTWVEERADYMGAWYP